MLQKKAAGSLPGRVASIFASSRNESRKNSFKACETNLGVMKDVSALEYPGQTVEQCRGKNAEKTNERCTKDPGHSVELGHLQFKGEIIQRVTGDASKIQDILWSRDTAYQHSQAQRYECASRHSVHPLARHARTYASQKRGHPPPCSCNPKSVLPELPGMLPRAMS
eukprot:1143529-Pelagomonas_calceolata.AAC.2